MIRVIRMIRAIRVIMALSHTNIKEGVHNRLSHKYQRLTHDRLSYTNIKDWVHDRLFSHKHQGLDP